MDALLAQSLDGHYEAAYELHIRSGMGDCIIGDALTEKFNTKASGSTNSLASVMRAHQQVLKQMADTYRAAGQAFHAQEQGNTAAMG